VFELAWRGGATAARLHERRPGGDELPWGSLELARYSAEQQLEARCLWTTGVFTEYASAAAFSSLTTAMLQCAAPIDLIAASADIAVDELFHVELSARLVMELGGALPLEFDLANVAPKTTPGIRPLLRAAEIAIATSCVSESLSVPAIARSRVLATEPLIRAVIARLLADEGPHARLGFWFFDWANDALTDGERAHLATLACDVIEAYRSLWEEPGDPVGEDLRRAVTTSIATPLARYGIVLDPARLAALVA
jgi:hypothetical protein